MKKLFAAVLTATLVTPSAPAYALRGQEAAQTGLEEQLHDALQSPNDLVRATGRLASTVLGLTPVVVRPEPSRRAGLEEGFVEDEGELVEDVERLSVEETLLEIKRLGEEIDQLRYINFNFGLDSQLKTKIVRLPRIVNRSGDWTAPYRADLERIVSFSTADTKEILIRLPALYKDARIEVKPAPKLHKRPWSRLGVRQEFETKGLLGLYAVQQVDDLLKMALDTQAERGGFKAVGFYPPEFSDYNQEDVYWFSTGEFSGPTKADILIQAIRHALKVLSLFPSGDKVAGWDLRYVRYRDLDGPGRMFILGPSLDPFERDFVLTRRRPQHYTGLEEARVMVVADLREMHDPGATQLADDLEAAGKEAALLLPKDPVDLEGAPRGKKTVVLFVHDAVAETLVTLLPPNWRSDVRIERLNPNAEFGNVDLSRAADLERGGQEVIVGLDSNQDIGALDLSVVRGAKLLLDPSPAKAMQLTGYLYQIRAFLNRPEALVHVIIDLTSGSIRTVTIQGTKYYALDIAA